MEEEKGVVMLRCQRIGCDAKFTEEENPDDACRYHDSGPLFHDGMKEWSCCKQRSHDFSLFLALPGCKTGKHTTEKPVVVKTVTSQRKPVPVVAHSNSASSKLDCSRCRQGFFCSDHGSQPTVINSKPLSTEAVISSGSTDIEKIIPAQVKKIVDLNEPQKCKNKGCGKTFKEKDNHESACDYHPGPAVFHDRIRGWKCCNIHVKEFDKFMEIPPCTKGSYRLLGIFRSEVYTTDPANIEYFLKTNFQNYGKGWYNYKHLKDLLGDGIFTVDGELWRHQRKAASYEFSTNVLRDYSSGVFQSNAVKLARLIFELIKSDSIMDIQDLLMKSTMDSIFKIGFGVELDSLCQSSEEARIFTKAFDDCSESTLWRYVDAFWRIKKFFNIGSEARIKKDLKEIDKFVYKLISAKTEQVSSSQDSSNTGREDILSRFLNQESDPKYLRDIILNFIIAGKDTTAIGLSWFFYMLCKHPLIQEKIAKEIKEATNTNDNMSFEEFIDNVNADALDKMQYLHAALSETLRLYPPVPVDAKCCFSDDTMPDGFSVRKGDQVCYQPYAMGRMKFLWGDDAEEFRPERWLDDNGCFRHESSFKFTAFQAGPRICLGKDFAYRQMKIFSAILLGWFEFRLNDELKPVKYRTMITLQIDGPLHLRAFQRRHTHTV